MKKSNQERKDGHELFGQDPGRYAVGTFHTIYKELKQQDSDGFKGYVRMDVDHFEELVHHLSAVVFSSSDNFCFGCTFLLSAILLHNVLDRMFWFVLNFWWM